MCVFSIFCFSLSVHKTIFIIGLLNGLLISFDKVLVAHPSMIISYGCMRLEPVAPFFIVAKVREVTRGLREVTWGLMEVTLGFMEVTWEPGRSLGD